MIAKYITILLFLFAGANTGLCEQLYTEPFTGDGDVNVVGWNGVYSTGSGGGVTGGLAWVWHKGNCGNIIYTREYTTDTSTYSNIEFGFDLRRHSYYSTTPEVSIAVEVGGAWYVSKTVFAETNTTFQNKTLAYNPSKDNWDTLNIATLSRGTTAASDLSGNITGFGLYSNSGTLLRKYIYGPAIDEPICMINVSGQDETKYYYHFDGLGSVVALSNENGTVAESYHYDIFGQPNTTSSIGNRFMFTGREYDSEAGLYYYRARYYKPSIGRFLQTDPIRYKGGINLYTYVKNNPIINLDPTGTEGYSSGDSSSDLPEWRSRGYPSIGSCMADMMSPICSPLANAIDAGLGVGGLGCAALGIIAAGWAVYCAGEALGAYMRCTSTGESL